VTYGRTTAALATTGGAIVGGLGGAKAGAVLGTTVVPVVGTVIGASVGGLLGATLGGVAGYKLQRNTNKGAVIVAIVDRTQAKVVFFAMSHLDAQSEQNRNKNLETIYEAVRKSLKKIAKKINKKRKKKMKEEEITYEIVLGGDLNYRVKSVDLLSQEAQLIGGPQPSSVRAQVEKVFESADDPNQDSYLYGSLYRQYNINSLEGSLQGQNNRFKLPGIGWEAKTQDRAFDGIFHWPTYPLQTKPHEGKVFTISSSGTAEIVFNRQQLAAQESQFMDITDKENAVLVKGAGKDMTQILYEQEKGKKKHCGFDQIQMDGNNKQKTVKGCDDYGWLDRFVTVKKLNENNLAICKEAKNPIFVMKNKEGHYDALTIGDHAMLYGYYDLFSESNKI